MRVQIHQIQPFILFQTLKKNKAKLLSFILFILLAEFGSAQRIFYQDSIIINTIIKESTVESSGLDYIERWFYRYIEVKKRDILICNSFPCSNDTSSGEWAEAIYYCGWTNNSMTKGMLIFSFLPDYFYLICFDSCNRIIKLVLIDSFCVNKSRDVFIDCIGEINSSHFILTRSKQGCFPLK